MAPLLPKLRGYFAEFLKESSLALLSMLYPPPVSVWYRYFKKLCDLFYLMTNNIFNI